MKTRHARQIRVGIQIARLPYRLRARSLPYVGELSYQAFIREAVRIERLQKGLSD